jgi:FkbM family methyltransferase
MNKLIKAIISKIILILLLFIKSPRSVAKLYSFFSRWLYDKNNTLEYDERNKLYWCKFKSLYLYAEYKPTFNFSVKKLYRNAEKICCLNYRPLKNDVIVDVGAGVGTELGYFIEKIGEGGKVFNIEASPSTFHLLNELKVKNNSSNVLNFNIAISNKNGSIWIEENSEHEKARINSSANGTEIKALTLDQFVLNNNINIINFLKVNIEGAEYDMIDGMAESIKITQNIAISCHDFLFDVNDRIRNKVLAFLKENDFTTFENETGHQVVDSWIYGKRN